MAHRPVGLNTSFSVSTSSQQSSSFDVRSKVLRVTALTSNVHVAIGTDPVATNRDYLVLAGTSETLALTPASSASISGITTGTVTTIDFLPGTASPFEVGDYVSLSSPQEDYNFSHKPVLFVDNSTSYDGYFSGRIVIDVDTSGISTAFSTSADLRKSLKVAGLGSGNGTLYIQQVQISGDA
jgi:hypothetical protein